MERIVDLDEANLEVARRSDTWEKAGLTAQPVTWRDGTVPWPYRFETDRAAVSDPDSLGLVITGPAAELALVLYRGGWADVDYFAGLDDAGTIPACEVGSAADFGERLDSYVARVFGAPVGGAAV